MNKLYILGLIILVAVIIGLAWADELTLTTYYPAPYGVYNDMVVMNSLGIGTTGPATILELSSSDATTLRITDTGDNSRVEIVSNGDSSSIETDTNHDLLIKTAGSMNQLFLQNGGNYNVGIGTTQPQAKLHIGGTAGTDGIMFPDGTLQTTAGGGKIVQKVYKDFSSYERVDLATTPYDDTKPRWNEVTEVTGLTTSITPTSATNYLYFDVMVVGGSVNTQNHPIVLAIYQDPSGTDECLACICEFPNNNQSYPGGGIYYRYRMPAGTTDPITFKIGLGCLVGGRYYEINGWFNSRRFGGAYYSSFTITEVAL